MITLATLPQATAQQVFDQVATHLLTQKQKAQTITERDGKVCCYRTSDGLKCAAGCLISDEEYHQFVGSNINFKPWYIVSGIVNVQGVHDRLINDLQNCHDGVEETSWKDALSVIATDHKLSPAVLEQFKS